MHTTEQLGDCGGQLASLLPPVLPVAYRVALHLTRDPAEAEDVVQDAALSACRAFAQFQPGTNFKAWFLRIVTNAFISRYRRVRRQGMAISLEDLDRPGGLDGLAAEQLDPDSDPLGGFLSRVAMDQILAALDTLPLEYRTVAVLYFVDDLSYQDIAAVVGCPIGTVRSRLHRGREHLKRTLRNLAVEQGVGLESSRQLTAVS